MALQMLDEEDNDADRYARVTQMVNQMDGDPEARSSPMLLLCYTNHALDQFLSELLSRIDTKALAEETAGSGGRARDGARGGRAGEQSQTLNAGIVRIGGRSKDEKLDHYTLRALRDQLRVQRKVPMFLHRGMHYSFTPETYRQN